MRLALMKHKPAQMQIRSTAKTRMIAMTTFRFIVVDAVVSVGEVLGLDVYGGLVETAYMRE